jgi:hypothetical protein
MTPPKILLLYDDTRRLPEAVRDLLPVRRYGDLMSGGIPNARRLAAAAAQAGLAWRHLRTREDWEDLADDARRGRLPAQALWWPARLVPAADDDGAELLRQAALLDPGAAVAPAGAGDGRIRRIGSQTLAAVAAAGPDGAEQALAEATPLNAPAAAPVLDLADPLQCLRFLSGAFRTRFFNDIVRDRDTVVKRSADRAKMKAEHDFWYLLPPEMQRHFVQPYGFEDDGRIASYRMERLGVPDASVLWTHGAFREDTFADLLDRLFAFLRARPRRAASPAEAAAARDALHGRKLADRVAHLKTLPLWTRLEPLLAAAHPGGLDAAVALHGRLRDRIRPTAYGHLAIGHGDLCLSNILYDPRTRLLRLIDPKGGTTRDALFMDPGYDLAKLSHSILGGYDFVVKGLADLQIGPDMAPSIHLPDHEVAPHQAAFRRRLAQEGIDVDAVRLDEASLFLSMLPLHADDPRRVLGLALVGVGILEDLAKRHGA